MKIDDRINELRGMDKKTLLGREEQLRKELSRLRISAPTGHIKDSSQFRKLRKDIARVLTIISQRRSSGEKS